MSGADADIKVGNSLPLKNIPVGTIIHNIELQAGKGGQLVSSVQEHQLSLWLKKANMLQVRLPSGEVRYVKINCRATIGTVGNLTHEIVNYGKAGRERHMGGDQQSEVP